MTNTQKTICCLLLSTFVNLYTSFMQKMQDFYQSVPFHQNSFPCRLRILVICRVRLELSFFPDTLKPSALTVAMIQEVDTRKCLVSLGFARSSVLWSVNRWCYDHVTLRDFKSLLSVFNARLGQRVQCNQQNLFTTNPVRSSVWGVFLTLTEQHAL